MTCEDRWLVECLAQPEAQDYDPGTEDHNPVSKAVGN